MEKDRKYFIAGNIIKKKIGNYLNKRNYEFNSIEIIKGINNSDSLSISFENSSVHRGIDFHYTYLDFRHEIANYFIVFIERKPRGVASIEDIFQHNKIKYDNSKFFLINHVGTFEQQVEQFCDYIIDLFEKYLQEWIKGEKWEDIPIDWRGYK